MIRIPATTIATATSRAVIESKATTPVTSTSAEADEHARARSSRRCADARRRPPGPATRARGPGARARSRRPGWRRPRTPSPRSRPRATRPRRRSTEPAGRLEDDDPGADQDQHPLDRGRQALDLLVAVGVLGVGRLVGLADRDEGDHRGDQVDQRVDRLGDDRDRAGDRPGGELDRDQQRVGDDRERRRRRTWCGSPPVQPPTARRAQQPRGAAPVADRVLLAPAPARPSCADRPGRCRSGTKAGS